MFPSFPSPAPLLPPFCSRPIFCAAQARKLICVARILFASYWNARYTGHTKLFSGFFRLCDSASRCLSSRQPINQYVVQRAKQQTIVNKKPSFGVFPCPVFHQKIYRKVQSLFSSEEALSVLTTSLSIMKMFVSYKTK